MLGMVGELRYRDRGSQPICIINRIGLCGSTCVKLLFKGMVPFSFVASHTNVLGTHLRTHFFGCKDQV